MQACNTPHLKAAGSYRRPHLRLTLCLPCTARARTPESINPCVIGVPVAITTASLAFTCAGNPDTFAEPEILLHSCCKAKSCSESVASGAILNDMKAGLWLVQHPEIHLQSRNTKQPASFHAVLLVLQLMKPTLWPSIVVQVLVLGALTRERSKICPPAFTTASARAVSIPAAHRSWFDVHPVDLCKLLTTSCLVQVWIRMLAALVRESQRWNDPHLQSHWTTCQHTLLTSPQMQALTSWSPENLFSAGLPKGVPASLGPLLQLAYQVKHTAALMPMCSSCLIRDLKRISPPDAPNMKMTQCVLARSWT